jgi:ribosomal protein S18 acetylase RimI-like enzyme
MEMENNKDFEIRYAKPEDEEELARLWWDMQSSQTEYETLWYATKPEEECKVFWKNGFRKMQEDNNALVVVACASDTPIGMIVARISGRPEIYLHSNRIVGIWAAVVDRSQRGKGVFRKMLRFLEDEARKQGIMFIKLSVAGQNEAMEAYKKTGFAIEQVGMIKNLS